MRAFGRVLILGGLLCAFAPAPASAAPILQPSPDSGPCDDVLGVENSSCSLFSLGALTGTATFDFLVEFTSDRDVALFEFSIDADATIAAGTSSTGLFPLLGVFSADKTIYSYIDPAVDPEVAVQAFGFERLEGVSLAGDSLYYLAVALFPNEFTGLPTSLLAPFACDGENRDGLGPDGMPLCPGTGGSFNLQFSTTSMDGGPQPVPEPGTLALLGSGLLAVAVRRRAKKRI